MNETACVLSSATSDCVCVAVGTTISRHLFVWCAGRARGTCSLELVGELESAREHACRAKSTLVKAVMEVDHTNTPTRKPAHPHNTHAQQTRTHIRTHTHTHRHCARVRGHGRGIVRAGGWMTFCQANLRAGEQGRSTRVHQKDQQLTRALVPDAYQGACARARAGAFHGQREAL